MSLFCFFRRKHLCPGGSGASFERQHIFIPVEAISFEGQTKLIAVNVPGNDATTLAGAESPNFLSNIGSNSASLSVEGTFQDIRNQEIFEWGIPYESQPSRVPNVQFRPRPFIPDIGITATDGSFPSSDLPAPPPPGPGQPPPPPPRISSSDDGTIIQAESLRDAMLNFWADQGNFEEIEFGWPSWIRVQGASDGSQGTTIPEDILNFRYYDPGNASDTGEAVRDSSLRVFELIDPAMGGGNTIIYYRVWRGEIEKISHKEEGGAPSQFPFSISFKVGAS